MGNNKKLDRKLYDAVKANKVDMAKKLLAEGANPDAPVGKKGMTSMQRAANLSDREMERVLLSKGGTLHSSSTLAGQLKDMFKNDEANKDGTFVVRQDSLDSSHAESIDSERPPFARSVTMDSTDSSPNRTGTYLSVRDEKTEAAIEEGEEVERSHSPEKVRPEVHAMSQLALGVGSSIRLKTGQRPSVGDDTFEKSEPDKPETTPEPAKEEWTVPSSDDFAIKMNPKHRDWEFDRTKLKQEKKLGEGHFGVVFAGLAQGIIPGEHETRVAVKMLADTSFEAKDDFLKEAEIMKAIDGDHNIIRLLGVCTEKQPYLMIMELMSKGDLKSVLRASRPKTGKPSLFSLRLLVKMASDVAEGMSYLAFMKIVHRDLAARNCLVNDEYTVKIGDFGLTRDVYSGEYYRMTGSTPLPIRWMAPEAIMDGVYTTASDIWAFGIVLWELMTFAKMPYAGMSNMEVCEQVTEDGFRLPQPRDCPVAVYDVMKACWDEDPDSRPEFDDLYDKLSRLSARMSDDPISKDKPSSGQPSNRNSITIGGDAYDNMEDGELQNAPGDYEYQMPTDSTLEQNYSGDAYVLREHMDGPESQALYEDTRYAGLPNIEQAIRRAKNENEIQEVKVEATKDTKDKVVQKQAEEVYFTANDAIQKESAPVRHLDGAVSDPSNPAVTVYKNVELDQSPTQLSKVREQWAEKDRTASVSVNNSPKRATSPLSSVQSAKDSTSPAKVAEDKKEPQKASMFGSKKKSKPKYGGATSWVTGGREGPATLYVPIARTKKTEPQTPYNKITDKKFLEEEEKKRAGPSELVTEARARDDNLLVSDKDFLANDLSETALKAKDYRRDISSQAEKDITLWIEAAIGDYLPEDTLSESLRSGEILCALMNKIKPGLVGKYHKSTRMAFKMMENIGWFLEACRDFGLSETDMFITVDLFENQNMKQVVICLSALKKLAEARGFST